MFAFDIRPDIVYRDNIIRVGVVFQSPLRFRCVQLSEIIDASICGGSPGITNEIRDSGKNKETKDRYGNHQTSKK